ncbi:MAG: hypothetical protein AAF355_10325 [Myxococcota bacterium]
MNRRALVWALSIWFVLTGASALALRSVVRTYPPAAPDDEAAAWCFDTLHAARLELPEPEAPAGAKSFRFEGTSVVTVWSGGSPVAQSTAESQTLLEVVAKAKADFQSNAALRSRTDWTRPRDDRRRIHYTLSAIGAPAPLMFGVPLIENLSLLPLHEGLLATLGSKHVLRLPEELLRQKAYSGGFVLPAPDTTLGVDIDDLVGQLARELGVSLAEFRARGQIARVRIVTQREVSYPQEPVAPGELENELRRAAREGAEFLLRHQDRSGRYTYVVEPFRGQRIYSGYNLPRHAGTTYFLAQAHRLLDLPEARRGAISALRWLDRHYVRRCGDHLCVAAGREANVGAAALTAIAAAELLATGEEPTARRLLVGLAGFLRSQQRPDGELMHLFDLTTGQPVDVQKLFYSGEAALALAMAERVIADGEHRAAAQRLMKHLTGASWDFFGSRYYYGEEHWTCIAAEAASQNPPRSEALDAGALGAPLEEALDFCMRWANWNRKIQYREGETPWNVRGAFGAGPGIIAPKLAASGSRLEAFVSTFEMARRADVDTAILRTIIEEGMGQLLRWRFDPGPAHLFRDPRSMLGGIPATPFDLRVRNDYVQHAGSAMLRWSEVLRSEAQTAR